MLSNAVRNPSVRSMIAPFPHKGSEAETRMRCAAFSAL
jgi:hypothetical protein